MGNRIKKPSFWSIFRSSLSQVRTEYKELVQLEKEKTQLLSSKSDWSLLEKLIQGVNTNPDLRVEVHLYDGTTLLLKTYKAPEKKTASQLIDGDPGEFENGSYVVQ